MQRRWIFPQISLMYHTSMYVMCPNQQNRVGRQRSASPIRFTNRYTLGMSPLNVKLDDRDVARLDEAIGRGFAANRSHAMRIALRSQLLAWDRQAWDDAWARAVPDESNEFADQNLRAVAGWVDLDLVG